MFSISVLALVVPEITPLVLLAPPATFQPNHPRQSIFCMALATVGAVAPLVFLELEDLVAPPARPQQQLQSRSPPHMLGFSLAALAALEETAAAAAPLHCQ
jgi:hypothetical protein